MLMTTAMLLTLLLAAPVGAATTRTESSRLEWREDGMHLAVEASQGVMRVRNAVPAGRFGVRAGDQILKVDGQPVHRVDDLTAGLARSARTQVPVTLLRDGREQVVEVSTTAWRGVLPPAPPPPPAPPTAPRH
ncbi:PDZ domain-containing protein [Bacillus subtilis subsp. subtilis]|nr:PDZ domain-containing protein [Bacillus subtilis subsp. subtilis]